MGKLKLIFGGIMAFATAILYALLQKEKAERADEHEQIAEVNRVTLDKNADAIIDGQKRQQAVKNEKVDTTNRNILS